MIDRNLEIVKENGWTYGVFNKYTCGKITRKKYILTSKEAATAQALIEAGNIYDIENFIQSII